MFDTTVDNKKEINELLENIKSIKNEATYFLILKFIRLFEDSAAVFSITTGFGIIESIGGTPIYARITLRVRHIATGRHYLVEHDRYLNGINKSKTSWVSNENWLLQNLNKREMEKSTLHFSKTKWVDVIQFVRYVGGS